MNSPERTISIENKKGDLREFLINQLLMLQRLGYDEEGGTLYSYDGEVWQEEACSALGEVIDQFDLYYTEVLRLAER